MAPIEITIVLVYKKPPTSGPSWSRTADSQHAPDWKSPLKIASQNGRTGATPISHTHYWSKRNHTHPSNCWPRPLFQLATACMQKCYWQSVFGWTRELSRERGQRTRHWSWKTALGKSTISYKEAIVGLEDLVLFLQLKTLGQEVKLWDLALWLILFSKCRKDSTVQSIIYFGCIFWSVLVLLADVCCYHKIIYSYLHS